MPELPEAETVRRGLRSRIPGRVVERVEVSGARSVRRHEDPGLLDARLRGSVVHDVGRVGKFLTVALHPPAPDAAVEVLVVHLGMSGQLLMAEPDAPPRPRHSHVVLVFSEGSELRFVDPRTFGQVFLSAGPAHDRPVELAGLGFDPLEDGVRGPEFARRLRSRRSMIKSLLMDQSFVAGLGNIYSDEILHAAGLRYDRRSDTVSEDAALDVHRQMLRILRASVRRGGSSLSDRQYRDVDGRLGRYQQRHRVFAREGRPCLTCGTPIVRLPWGGRSTFFCPSCQR